MVAVCVEILRFVDNAQPGWVECWLTDAYGRDWSFVEKVPIITAEPPDDESRYPRPGTVACRIVGRSVGVDGSEIVIIDNDKPFHITATTGNSRFVVRSEQIEEFDRE